MKRLTELLTANTFLVFRIVLFLTFMGHALVNIGLSPTIGLHIKLIHSVHFLDNFNPLDVTKVFAVIDLIFAIGILFRPTKIILIAAIIYLAAVGVSGWMLYLDVKNSIFGVAENMRRLPWLLFCLYLLYYITKGVHHYNWLRIGISFAFLAHGTASLGFLGLNAGHIELATKVIPEANVRDFVFYSGISDSILGLMLLTGIGSRIAAYIGTPWLLFIVFLSFTTAIPDGMFRSGFLVSIIYVALDKRCHPQKIPFLS